MMNLRTMRRRLNVAIFVSMWTVLLIAALWPAAVVSAQACEQVMPKLTASDGAAGDGFGSVSINGDTAIVGAYNDDDLGIDSGSAYIFVRSGPPGSEVWTQQQKLTASDGAANKLFGWSVSISGDTAIVGTRDLFAADIRSAYVFVRSEGVWIQQQKLTASDGAAGDLFGLSVSISGDTAIVGSPTDDDLGFNSGSAYVFIRSGPPGSEVWTQQQKLTASDGAAGDQWGGSVSISGDTAIVSAELDDDLGISTGSAYVFVRSGTVWTQQQKLTASDGAAGDKFGNYVSISGDTAIVGATLDDDLGTDSGSAYMFVRDRTLWTQQQKLTASDGAATDYFGWSVSISGDAAIVSAWGNDDLGANSGSAYVFARSGTVWTQQQKLTASDGAADDIFGFSASISGDTAVVGANGDDDLGSASGSACVFECPTGPACPGNIVGEGDVDVDDLLAVINAWGSCPKPCPPHCAADTNDDCTVNVDDLLAVINNWGPCR